MLDFFQSRLSTGRIGEIINLIKQFYKTDSIHEIPTKEKLGVLCCALQIDEKQFDLLISQNPQTIRTIKGHAFETVFDRLMAENNVEVSIVGGDTEVDRVVNGVSLQLKTPTISGTTSTHVIYKTHKTHGAKSETESMEYYSKAREFSDYLLGLVTYKPFTVVFIHRNDLPRVQSRSEYIQSPFKYNLLSNTKSINNFNCINVNNLTVPSDFFDFDSSTELLPLTTELLGLKTEIIVDTILEKSNFRIWDMNMRGFARELTLCGFLNKSGVKTYNPSVTGKPRADKSDIALQSVNGEFVRFQVKGITLNCSTLDGVNSIVDIETQLSRGRVNDHPTQSRLYHYTDFENLILCIDPSYAKAYNTELHGEGKYDWEFYCIPQNDLKRHKIHTERINSHQQMKYVDIQDYRINKDWTTKWR